MLSYQHAYHAGNAADVHKHALLAVALDYLTRKDKPLSYLETHAGRGLYDLDSAAARQTGEARAGIAQAEQWLPQDHPLMQALSAIRDAYGPRAYPGSPLIAQHFLRAQDKMDLAELHPAECEALRDALPRARIHARDGFEMAKALCPPTPRRGLLLIDPSYEVKSDYDTIPAKIAALARKWPVGVIALWYPVLATPRHGNMLAQLRRDFPEALHSEIGFAPARSGHGMTGSGMFVINPPWGLDEAARWIGAQFRQAG